MCKLARLTRRDTYTDSVKFSPIPYATIQKGGGEGKKPRVSKTSNLFSLFFPPVFLGSHRK